MKHLISLLTLGFLVTLASGVQAQTDETEAPEALQTVETEGDDDEVVTDDSAQLKDEMNLLLARAHDDPSLLAPGSEGEAFLVRLAEQEGSAPAAYNLGIIYLRDGNLTKARFYFQMTLDKDPAFSEAVAQMGIISLREGRKEEAEALMTKAVEMDKYCSVARDYYSSLALKQGELDEAIRHCRIALLGDPFNMNAYLNMAIAWYQKGKLDVSELVCKSALLIDKKNAPILNLMGLIRLKKGDIRGAFSFFEESSKADPTFVDASKNLAAMALNYKDFGVALQAIDLVLKQEPTNDEFVMSRAVALRGLGRMDEARTVLEGLLSRNPGFQEARYNLCILLADFMSQFDQALRVCSAFRDSLDSKHPKWKEMQVKVRGIEETIKAMEEMKEMEKSNPTPPAEEATPPAEEATEEMPVEKVE